MAHSLDRDTESDWLTTSEAAALTNPPISISTLVRWENEGKLTAVKTLGGHRRFRRDEIESLLGGGQAVGNSGHDSVSSAPTTWGESDTQTRLDRPAAPTSERAS